MPEPALYEFSGISVGENACGDFCEAFRLVSKMCAVLSLAGSRGDLLSIDVTLAEVERFVRGQRDRETFRDGTDIRANVIAGLGLVRAFAKSLCAPSKKPVSGGYTHVARQVELELRSLISPHCPSGWTPSMGRAALAWQHEQVRLASQLHGAGKPEELQARAKALWPTAGAHRTEDVFKCQAACLLWIADVELRAPAKKLDLATIQTYVMSQQQK